VSEKSGNGAIYNILVFGFADPKTAGEVVRELELSQRLGGYRIVAEAVVERDKSGKVHVHEPGRGGVGGTIGAVAGGLAGLFIGPLAVLLLAVTGGALGGVAGHFAGRALPAEDLEQIADALPPNSSAFVALVEDMEAEQIIDDMSDYRANIVTITVGDELSGEIDSVVAMEVENTSASDADDSVGSQQNT
jgi:uncharacterized membrane protein